MEAVSLWAPASHYAAGVINHKAELALLGGIFFATGTEDERNVASNRPAATTTGSGAAR